VGTALRVVVALAAVYVLLRVGLGLLRGFARPLPEPPPPGEMRRVKLRYRCSVCGMELRVDRALSEDPPAPRHCMEEMDVVAPVE
jgi:hypothetical protein